VILVISWYNCTDFRSDGNIRYYEYENDKFEYLTQYTSPNPQRGIAFLPKRGINLHENEVLRAFKTVNDTYIEPVSFIVPRRSEMFQSDIYPPTTGLKAGTTTEEWFGGKTAVPPKISLESVYDGEAPKEVPSESKPSQPIVSQPAPAKASAPAPSSAPSSTPAPAPTASRGPPPSMNDNKQSLAAGASKFADDDVSDKESESSFEEVAKPVSRPTATATRQEEKIPAATKPTPASTITPSEPGATLKSADTTPSAAAPSSTPAPSSGGPAAVLRDTLSDIKSQLEHQTRVMSDQSDQIALLVREVTQLKSKLGSHEPSDREKDERIRQLELELEEARS
jgi:coronin-1B/1C/6